MTMKLILIIVFLTLFICSFVKTIVLLITDENETLKNIFSYGIFGCFIAFICKIIRVVKNKIKYHLNKRSIFEDKITHIKYCCKTKYTNDVIDSASNKYTLIKRYANKYDWKNLPSFTNEEISNFCIRCYNCKYNDICFPTIMDIDLDYEDNKHIKCNILYDENNFSYLEYNKFIKK